MKFSLLFITIIFFTSPILSQMTSYIKSEPLITEKKSKLISSITVGNHGYYIRESNIKRNKFTGISAGDFTIHRFDLDLKTSNSCPVKFPYHEKKSNFKYMTILDTDLLVFTSSYNQKKKIKEIHLQRFDPLTLEAINDKEVILSSTFKKNWQKFSEYGFKLSSDNSKLLIYDEDVQKKIRRSVHFCIIDKACNKLWEGSFSLKDMNAVGEDIIDAAVDNHGNLIFLTDKLKIRKKGDLTTIEGDIVNKKFKERILNNSKDQKIRNVRMRFDQSSSIIIGGFFGKKNKHTDGFFFGKWKFSDENPKIIFNPFSDEFKKEKENNVLIKKMKRYELVHFYITKKGNICMTGEQVEKVEFSSKTLTSSTHSYQYKFGNIIFLEFKPNDLSILRKGKIKKKGLLRFKYNRDFYFNEKGDDLVFIFNNHPDNINSPSQSAKKTGGFFGQKKVVSCVLVDSEGQQHYHNFFEKKPNAQFYINPRKFIKTSDNEIITSRKNKEKVNIIKYLLE